ncbi:hypothetical protein [Streptomyces sp. NPDC048636]|uniref:hypothetical protein n=1 Tax=Streptomyces sp. NPDC048636 TaxID=3155762 RepID=UPI0034400D14
MKTIVRRSAMAASAVSLALMASACGGEESTEPERSTTNSTSAKEEQQAAEPKGPTAAELKSMLLKQGDAKGLELGEKDEAADVYAQDSSAFIKADKQACLPLARAFMALPQGSPDATTGTGGVRGLPKKKHYDNPSEGMEAMEKSFGLLAKIRMEMISLSSYHGQGAAQALAGLKKAGTQCSQGFTATPTKSFPKQTDKRQGMDGGFGDGPVKFSSVSALPADWGDESAAWNITLPEQAGSDISVPVRVAAVRKGQVLALFSTTSFNPAHKGQLPEKTIAAQLAKLN